MNPSPSRAIPSPAPTPRRWRWLRGVLLFFALAILAAMAILGYSYFSLRSDWTAAEAEASKDDPRWRLMEIEADRPAIADAENSALHIITVHRKGKGVSVGGVPNYHQIFVNVPPTAQLNAQQIRLIRGELGKIAKPLQEARLLKDMPHGRFPIKYSDDFFSTPIADRHYARNLAEWLIHDAWLFAQDEQYDQAVESCRATLNAARAMAGDPSLISWLIRIAIQNMSVTSLERVLAQGEASHEQLLGMQTLLEKESLENGWLPAIRGERAGHHHLFENMRDGNVSMPGMLKTFVIGPGTIGDSITAWFFNHFPATMLQYYPDFLRVMNRNVAIAKLPIHEREPKMLESEQSLKTTDNPIIRMLVPAMATVHQRESRSQAMLRSAIVALACERYRLKHQEWPASLDLLVKEKWLAELPSDPMDNQPLRYRRHADGIVVYSIGMDKIDNQGNIDQDHPSMPGVDIGFRLWNTDKRRRAPLPPVAIVE